MGTPLNNRLLAQHIRRTTGGHRESRAAAASGCVVRFPCCASSWAALPLLLRQRQSRSRKKGITQYPGNAVQEIYSYASLKSLLDKNEKVVRRYNFYTNECPCCRAGIWPFGRMSTMLYDGKPVELCHNPDLRAVPRHKRSADIQSFSAEENAFSRSTGRLNVEAQQEVGWARSPCHKRFRTWPVDPRT